MEKITANKDLVSVFNGFEQKLDSLQTQMTGVISDVEALKELGVAKPKLWR